MYYKGWYIETNGKEYRIYRKRLFFKVYYYESYNGESIKYIERDLDRVKERIDKIITDNDWHLVEPIRKVPYNYDEFG